MGPLRSSEGNFRNHRRVSCYGCLDNYLRCDYYRAFFCKGGQKAQRCSLSVRKGRYGSEAGEAHAERQEERRRRREEQVSGVNLARTDLSAYASGDEDFEDELLSRPEPDFREDSTAGADDSIRRDSALAEGPDEQSDFGAFHTEKPEVVPSGADVFTAAFLFRRNIRMGIEWFPLMWMRGNAGAFGTESCSRRHSSV